ncbi:serine/threonine-protein kinase [Kangiella sp. HZ709]|uniref:serine/threonine-protein kinase n=1 Tax=Kangiella sp. HZ709 TaxID=2666328 RepID=UPI0012AF1A88|nr:serine/threonine-protein kinase [Kangiella sp. HZ709]MRX26973.1 protein kinase [Kangiella sp. HZ709]
MDKSLWKKIEPLLIACEELPKEDVLDYLNSQTNDQELIERVLHYLNFSNQSNTIFSSIIGEAVQSSIELSEEGIPKKVGPYSIIEKIARGGMGTVYLAQRDDDIYDKKVVIKIVNGILSEQHKYRFQQERKILAKLQHQNIAQIIDGGSVDSGQHYLIMEYVEGIRIDRYCDKNDLSIEQRIKLFKQVAEAARYAHRNLIVHRDIKPSNILVDNSGNAKLLDFGIAKILNPEEEMDLGLTRTHMRLMTPEYASPEQVKGEDITLLSDVYSLGALLYELIVGAAPIVITSSSPAEIERTICETTPVRLRTSLKRQDSNRVIDKKLINSSLVKDLDNILLKALRKEPENRYETVKLFIDDLDNLLNNKPVTASPISKLYLASKFIKRNLWQSLLAGVSATAIAGLISIQYISNKKLQQEKEEAETQAEISRQTANYFSKLIESADPEFFQGREITVREALDQSVDELLATDELNGKIKSRLLHMLGRVYRNRNNPEKSLPLQAKAIELREAHDDGKPSYQLGQMYGEYGDNLRQLNRYDLAPEAFEKSIAILEQLTDDLSIKERANTYNNSGIVYSHIGNYQRAKEVLEYAIELTPEPTGQKSSYYFNYARNFLFQKKLKLAQEFYQKSYDLKLDIYGPLQRRTLNTLYGMALTEYELGNYKKAKNQMELTLTERIKMFGDDNSIVESTRSFLMLMHAKLDEWEQAETIFKRLRNKAFDEDFKLVENSNLPRMATYIEIKNDKELALNYWSLQLDYLQANQPHRTRSIHIAYYNKLRLLHELKKSHELTVLDKAFFQTVKDYYPKDSLEVARINYLEAQYLNRVDSELTNSILKALNSEIIDDFKKSLFASQPELN